MECLSRCTRLAGCRKTPPVYDGTLSNPACAAEGMAAVCAGGLYTGYVSCLAVKYFKETKSAYRAETPGMPILQGAELPRRGNFLAHGYNHIVFRLAFYIRDNMSVYRDTVHGHGDDALLYIVRVFHLYVIDTFPELSGDLEIPEARRNTGVNGKPRVGGGYAQNVLGHVDEGPGCRAREPAVFCLAVEFCVSSCHHLGVDIGLGAVNLADILNVGGTSLLVDLKGSVASSDDSFSDGDPGIVVTEDTCVLLVSRG